MSSRRSAGEGSIYPFKDGYAASIELGLAESRRTPGKITRQRKVIYGQTRKEVVEKLRQIRRELEHGGPAVFEKQTVSAFLDDWLEQVVRQRNRPKTYDSYRQMIHSHLEPSIGRMPVTKLTPQDVQRLLNRKQADGLSPRSVQYLRGILRSALNQALKWGLVTRNVAALADSPKVERFITHPLTMEQAHALLDAARGNRLEALYRVALSLGLRRGEALGLRWQDVNFDAGTLRVSQTLQVVGGAVVLAPPKTKMSERTLALPPALVAALREHRTRQAAARLQRGAWPDHDLIFTTGVGTPMSPRNLLREFKQLLKNAGLPDMRFHDLRHSCASLLAAQGVPPRVAMDILGHSNITTTQNVYTHVLDDSKRRAADVMERLFGERPAGADRAGS